MIAKFRRLLGVLVLFWLVHEYARLFPETVQRALRSVAEILHRFLYRFDPSGLEPLPLTLLAWAGLMVLSQKLAGGDTLQMLAPVNFRAKGSLPGLLWLSGKQGSASAEDYFSAGRVDYVLASTSGWLKRLLCVLTFGVPVVYCLNENSPVGAGIVGVVGLVVLIILCIGQLVLASTSGHAGRYFGVGVAGHFDSLALPSNAIARFHESSVWSQERVAVNFANVSSIIVGRRIRWGWILVGTIILGLGLMARFEGTPRMPEEAQHGFMAGGGSVVFIGLVLSFFRVMLVQFVGGGTVALAKQGNIESALNEARAMPTIKWLLVERGGLMGKTQYLFNRRGLCLVGSRAKMQWLLFVIVIFVLLVGARAKRPELLVVGLVLLILAIVFSLPTVSFYSLGGFVHRFWNRSAREDAQQIIPARP